MKNNKNQISGLDNKYDCPPMMSDGRLFTDFRPRCAISQDNSACSYDSRQNLINNATKEIEKNRKNAYDKAVCIPEKNPFKEGNTLLDEKYIVQCDKKSCRKSLKNEKGLGTGRGYSKELDKYYTTFLDIKNNEFNMNSKNKTSKSNQLVRSTIPSGAEL